MSGGGGNGRDESGAALEAVPQAQAVAAAVQRLLVPFVRLLVANQLTYPWITRLLKRVYVQVALAEFALPDLRPTDSRISLLTGVHRKDVRALRDRPATPASVPRSVSLGAQLVARWTTQPAFLDERGRPRALERRAGGPAPSFEDLVVSVTRDVRPRAVLDEWLRAGVVRIDEDERVRLDAEAFVPDRGFEEKAYYLGRDVGDHLAAAVHNVRGGKPPFLERNVQYTGLSEESVAEIEALAGELGMEALRRVNQRASELKRRDGGSAGGRRISFGVYFFSEPGAAGGRRSDDD